MTDSYREDDSSSDPLHQHLLWITKVVKHSMAVGTLTKYVSGRRLHHHLNITLSKRVQEHRCASNVDIDIIIWVLDRTPIIGHPTDMDGTRSPKLLNWFDDLCLVSNVTMDDIRSCTKIGIFLRILFENIGILSLFSTHGCFRVEDTL